MNQSPDSSTETEVIRSEIDQTRETIDDTIGAIGDRLKGRHLVDEVIGFFKNRANSTGQHSAPNDSSSMDNILNRALSTVKANPLPAILIGGGVAWMVYESRRTSRDGDTGMDDSDYYNTSASGELESGRSLASMNSMEGEPDESELGGTSGFASSTVGEAIESTWQKTKDKGSQWAEEAQQKGAALKDSASNLAHRAGDQAQEYYAAAKQKAGSAVEDHPLAIGLGCLAAGALIGLALPVPQPAVKAISPYAQRFGRTVRASSQDVVSRGKKVVQAAADAAKQAAQKEGFASGDAKGTGPSGPGNPDEQGSAVGNESGSAGGPSGGSSVGRNP